MYKQIERSCVDNYKEKIGESFDNIFKYIMPTTIYIKHSKTNERAVGILCNFKFEPGHSLAIVIKNEQIAEIGGQDIIL